jgi:hypothetical protein
LKDQGLGKLHNESCLKAALEEKRAHFSQGELERKGEESQVSREIELKEKRD